MHGHPTRSLAYAILLGVSGCGGGDGGGSEATRALSGTIYVELLDDGEMAHGATVPTGGRFGLVSVGNDAADREVRGLIRFDLTRVPLGARIVSAVLRVQQTEVVGAPYPALGSVVLDQVDAGTSPWTSETYFPTDPGGVNLADAIATLSVDALLGERSADVTGALQTAIDLSLPTLDLRVRFSSPDDSDATEDVAGFSVGPESDGGPAALDVVYKL